MLRLMPLFGGNRITKRINRVIKKVEKEKFGFLGSYKAISQEIQKTYSTASIEEIVERKHYLEYCIDNPHGIYTTLVLAILSWYLVEVWGLPFVVANQLELNENILRLVFVVIVSVLYSFFVAALFTRNDRRYLSYDLKDTELKLINAILDHELHNDWPINAIVASRCPNKPAEPNESIASQPEQPDPPEKDHLPNPSESEPPEDET